MGEVISKWYFRIIHCYPFYFRDGIKVTIKKKKKKSITQRIPLKTKLKYNYFLTNREIAH